MSRPAAAAVALQRVGGVGDELQLLEDELRDHERAVEKAGLADVGDAAVDDHAGVENAIALLRTGVAEEAGEPLRLQPLAFPRAHHDPEVREDEQDEAVQEDDAVVGRVGPEQRGANRLGEPEADGAADQRAEQIGHLRLAQPRFDDHDQRAERRADGRYRRSSSGWNGRRSAAAQATAATKHARATICQGMGMTPDMNKVQSYLR